MKRAVVFGAGSVGRGFVGALLGAAGWRVTFVDVVASLVGRLREDGYYHQVIVDNGGDRTVRIEGVDALLLSDAEGVARALADADLAATAVGAANLEPVARLLAAGAELRRDRGCSPLDVLLCENLHGAPGIVRGLVAAASGDAAADGLGLVATSIGRMIPVPVPDPDDPTRVRVEPYAFLPYDATALRGPRPEVAGLVPVADGFDLYADRKLYVHNMGHCMLAHLGELAGLEFVWEAVGDLGLRYLVRGAMVESATALAADRAAPAGPLLEHVDDLLNRFGNRALADTNERVGRDPVRKMQPDDRILGSYRLCVDAGVRPRYVALAVALGVRRLGLEDGWPPARAREHAAGHLEAADAALVDRFLRLLDGGLDAAALVAAIDAEFAGARVV